LCYQIELACDVRAEGVHSAKSHYVRQKDKYSTMETIDSIVVIIYHFRWDINSYYWPEQKDDGVNYIIVEHILDETPEKYTILIPKYENNELQIQEEEVTVPPTHINGMYKFKVLF